MSEPIFFDTETVCLEGPIVLIQYSIGYGEVVLVEPWKEPFKKTLELIEKFCSHEDGVIGFNLVFDWFQICKLYTMWDLFCKKHPERINNLPEDYINELGILEKEARDGPCCKPVTCHDVMLHARKGPYQSVMKRKSIIIKKVPNALAYPLAQKLETLIPLNNIYFAKRADKHLPKWSIDEVKDHPDFKNLVLRFKPSSALKALAVDALGIKEAVTFGDISLSKKAFPSTKKKETLAHAPFALAVAPNYFKTKNWGNSWPSKIRFHINHWKHNSAARKYAETDVIYTRELYKYFGEPELGDDDSELTCLVGAARWRGYAIDIERIKQLRREALIKKNAAPKDSRKVREYICESLGPIERLIIKDSTKKIILEEIAKWEPEECDCVMKGMPLFNCANCNGTGVVKHPASIKAQAVLDARSAAKEIENYDKLIQAERFHVSSSVIGALSGRSSGSGGGINSQGIKKTKQVRSCFPLAFPGWILGGGDFIAFEVVLADANYNDPKLREYLLTGKKIHAIFGTFFYPGKTYQDILDSDGTDNDLYTRAKSGVFALFYGGEPYTLMTRLGVTAEAAEIGFVKFTTEFTGIGNKIREISTRFQSMTQPHGLGTKVEWRDPDEYIETMYGFKRYFTLENKICKALFELAENPPKEWTKLKINVMRRDRDQSVSGATRSALFASAFMIQGQVKRAAINHIIQGSGAYLCKKLQREIWDIQPSGIGEWLVQPFNIHDELQNPSKSEVAPEVERVVNNFIEEHKVKVPLLAIDWHSSMRTWADK